MNVGSNAGNGSTRIQSTGIQGTGIQNAAVQGTGGQPSVLIVEDEMCLAMMLEDILLDAGYDVHKAARVPGALDLVAARHFDAAILDINLAGKQVFPVADALLQCGTPFMFTSGYGEGGVPAEYQAHAMLQKPYDVGQLQQTLGRLLQAHV